ncbi:MAG: Flp pilus assembly protein CpaB [Thiotrichales bacterium]|nr:Flp pilus assembly protein CpaB [Thiotrichales bacterium]
MAESSTSKTLLLLILSVVFGIVAAIFTGLYLKSREAAILRSMQGEEQQMVDVVVAKYDIPMGIQVELKHFDIGSFPANLVHANAVTPPQFQGYVGRFVATPIGAGKPLLTAFMSETFPVDFSDLVEEGRRAVTIQVDEVNSFAGFLRPGNHIDLFVNIEIKEVGFQTEEEAAAAQNIAGVLQQVAAQSTTGGDIDPALVNDLANTFAGGGQSQANDVVLPVLQDIRVLATGREPYDANMDSLSYPQQRTGRNYTSITVDVSAEEAGLIALAEDKGALIAVLRNRKDRGLAEFTGVTPLDLFKKAQELQKLALMRKAAAEAGATIDENGNWVTPDGKVIKKEDIVISENGTVTTKGGQLLAAKGITMNENGEYVDENGNVIPPDQLVFNEDGTVTTKDEMMKAAGYTINENGDYVDADGNVISKDDVKVLANGTVVGPDGKVISGPNVTVNEHGFIIGEDGTVMTADGKILEGVTVDENGNVIGPDGKIMTDANLIVDADGTVRDKDGNIIAGISGSSTPPGFGAVGAGGVGDDVIMADLPANLYRLIIGGASEDGVPKSQTLPVESVKIAVPPAAQ